MLWLWFRQGVFARSPGRFCCAHLLEQAGDVVSQDRHIGELDEPAGARTGPEYMENQMCQCWCDRGRRVIAAQQVLDFMTGKFVRGQSVLVGRRCGHNEPLLFDLCADVVVDAVKQSKEFVTRELLLG